MKRITVTLLVLVFAAGMVVAPDADAGWFKKDKPKRTEKPNWMKKPHRFDNLPPMSFHSGVLAQDSWSGWKLGELKLRFADDCQITTEGAAEGILDAGRQAYVMGPKVGDTIVAWSVRVARPDFAILESINTDVVVEVSQVNPNCGEIKKAPH